MKTSDTDIRVGIVGPCTSGKSTLIRNLPPLPGIELRHIAQEHSYVPHMWQTLSKVQFLIYLHVSYQASKLRKQLNWTEAEYQEQLRRLSHAREHADLIVNTDDLTPEQVAQQVRRFLESGKIP